MSYTYDYPRPAVTTDALIICQENGKRFILLIERGIEPFKGQWALPGGFIEMNEDLETACAREVEEETGLRGIDLKQLGAYGAVDRDPRGRTISIVFYSFINDRITPHSGDDAASARWFNLNELPSLAFDHKTIIDDFLGRQL